MKFEDFYQQWIDREIKIKFTTVRDRIQYFYNWLMVALLLFMSAGVYYMTYREWMSNLLADILISCLMCCFLYFVLFGTKFMKKRRKELYENRRILVK